MMMKFDTSVYVGVNQTALSKGVLVPLTIDFKNTPHMILVAPSGGGKTYTLKYILKQLAEADSLIYLCDFKAIDFYAMSDCPNYFSHMDVGKGLDTVFDLMQNRIKNNADCKQPCYLVFDEWAGFLSSLPKKQQDEYKQKLSGILMLGRGLNIFVILSLQRADSSNFMSGARDNFGVALGLGRLSSESSRMLFPDSKDLQPKGRGKGYLRVDGKPLAEVSIPKIRDMTKTDLIIRRALLPSKRGGD